MRAPTKQGMSRRGPGREALVERLLLADQRERAFRDARAPEPSPPVAEPRGGGAPRDALRCERCDAEMMLTSFDSRWVCPECGTSRRHLDAVSASMAYGGDIDFTSFSYQRAGHFDEWLQHAQAKERTLVPTKVLETVMREFRRRRVTEPRDVRPSVVRKVLKDLRLRKYYANATQIACRLSGEAPPRVSPVEEEALRVFFQAMQSPYERYKGDRRNFLSYANVTRELVVVILKRMDFTDCFPRMSAPDKRCRQQYIIRQIWRDLGCEDLVAPSDDAGAAAAGVPSPRRRGPSRGGARKHQATLEDSMSGTRK